MRKPLFALYHSVFGSCWDKTCLQVWFPGQTQPSLLCDIDCHDFLHCGHNQLSRVMRKPDFCICENKDADQFRGNREADQRLCFPYTDSTIPLLPIHKILSL